MSNRPSAIRSVRMVFIAWNLLNLVPEWQMWFQRTNSHTFRIFPKPLEDKQHMFFPANNDTCLAKEYDSDTSLHKKSHKPCSLDHWALTSQVRSTRFYIWRIPDEKVFPTWRRAIVGDLFDILYPRELLLRVSGQFKRMLASIPNIFSMCFLGLAIVALQETNIILRSRIVSQSWVSKPLKNDSILPTAAQTRRKRLITWATWLDGMR